MANETQITIIGNLTSDPELRYTQQGHAVAGFTVASTPRSFDRQAGDWRDGETLYLRCSAWRDLAEHVAASLVKGQRVIAQGNLQQRSYETREGEKRTSIELDVQEIGPSLRYATATVRRAGRQQATSSSQETSRGGFGTGSGGFNSRPSGGQQWPASQPPASDGRDYDDEPPF